MPTFSIESNGFLEKTAVYYNGMQLGGIKEIFLNLDENGTFDAIIQYEGSDKEIHTKQIFEDVLDNIKTVEPSFTEDEAGSLRLLTVESDGFIDTTRVFIDDVEEEGIVSLLAHIKGAETEKSLKNIFSSKNNIPEAVQFKAEIDFRYDDGLVETEQIF